MLIALSDLARLDACTKQVNLFCERFPDGCDTATCTVEQVVGFDLDWAARHLLSATQRADYAAQRAPLDADYRARLASLDADYEARRASLDADYWARRAPLDADYEAQRAAAFLEVVNKEPSHAS